MRVLLLIVWSMRTVTWSVFRLAHRRPRERARGGVRIGHEAREGERLRREAAGRDDVAGERLPVIGSWMMRVDAL
jgi:hypothetical protein